MHIPYREHDHREALAEWPPHRGVSGWWYVTGVLAPTEELAAGPRFFFQFTVLRVRFAGWTWPVLQLAFTDLAHPQSHRFGQKLRWWERDMYPDPRTVRFGPWARLRWNEQDTFHLHTRVPGFCWDLTLQPRKPVVWHGDNGVLIMGVPEDPRQRTVYYSFTHLDVRGHIEHQGRPLAVQGRAWLDRQWGPYNLFDPRTHWEWFSLRLDTGEEGMIFHFPRTQWREGTWIDQAGRSQRLREYLLEPLHERVVEGHRFSWGWRLSVPALARTFELQPWGMEQYNLAYYELLAQVRSPAGAQVGHAVVELLPGARTARPRVGWRQLLRSVDPARGQQRIHAPAPCHREPR